MDESSPPLVRPVPRRPFYTPTSESDTDPSTPLPTSESRTNLARLLRVSLGSLPSASSSSIHLADGPSQNGGGTDTSTGTPSLPKSPSLFNLTSSALFGIFSPNLTGGSFEDGFAAAVAAGGENGEECNTPWGTGAQSPERRLENIDESTYKIIRRRRRSMYGSKGSLPSPIPPVAAPSIAPRKMTSMVVRAMGLFVLGIGYGALLARSHGSGRTRVSSDGEASGGGSNNSCAWLETVAGGPVVYFTVWGLVGLALGTLLPWFDSVWEAWATTNGKDEENDEVAVAEEVAGHEDEGQDWMVALRSVVAFVGIIFAIRKLPWDSTLQISMSLALVNPFLWYLIDRSIPGFVLSTAVCLTGSAVLLGVDPSMMPMPVLTLGSSRRPSVDYDDPVAPDNTTTPGMHTIPSGVTAAATHSLASVIWMMSVLFCCAVCFGNIGRRLARR